jgi:hypothetical protein
MWPGPTAREPLTRADRRAILPAMPSRRQLAVALGYLAASAVYVAIGIWFTDFLLSYFVGLAYLLLAAWLVPAGVRRLF